MPFRQIDLSQISTANSSNNQVIAVVANTIVWANVTASGGSANPLATSIVGLNTANVTESTSNLYFTNARVYSNIVSTLATYTGNIFAGNLTTTGATGGSITGANLLSTNNISSLNWIGLYTANVIETSGNLYFTNARVYSNIVSTLATYTGNINAGNIISGGALGGSLTGANLLSTNNISSLNWIGLYTANVIETSGNLYFTNARSRLAISESTGVSYNNTTGAISIGQNVSTTANVTFGQLNVTGNVNFYGNVTTYSSNNLSISDNMIYLNSGSLSSNPDLGFAGNYNDGTYKHTGFFRDASDGVWKVFDSYTPEPDASQFIDTGHASFRLANLSATTFTGNVIGTVNSINNFTTSNLSEGTNLYYTNARVYSNIVTTLATYTGNIFGGNLTTGGALGGSITGANLISANNFISTGGTITGANLISANNVTTTNITTTNLYTGSNGSGGSITGANLISANNVIATNFTTTNLYTGSNGSGGSITGANLITSNNITVTTLTATNVNIIGGITDTTGILSITTTGGTNANIELNANGTGRIGLDGMYWPNADGTAGQILQTSGTGDLSWTTPSAGGGGGSGLFNSSITSSNNYLATSTLSNAIVFSAKSILHSVYITNIDTSGSANIGVTATILGGGTNAPMLFNMPLPYRSSFEALKKPKVVNAGDAIQIQGLESGVGINNDVHATIVYEEITSGTYTGINSNIDTPYANVDIFTAASASIIESVMVSSTNNLGNIPITVTITNASNVIQGYMAYTLLVPVGATIELCEKPRRIASGHKIQAYTNAANAIAIFVAAKDV